MRTTALALAVLGLWGCSASRVHIATQGRDGAYLEELKTARGRPYGLCMATYHFLNDRGKEGVPTVLKAIELYSGPADASLRAQILNGAWHYDRASKGGDVILPIMRRASEDPDAKVSKKARDWLKAKEEKNKAK